MEAFQVVGQANQIPFAAYFFESAQEELPEAQDVFDDAEDRFDRAGPRQVQELDPVAIDWSGV
jgi:hypothetical protein